MSHDLTIQSTARIQGPGDSAAPAKGGVSGGRASVPATPVAKAVQPYTNPALRLDPALGLVVIEFHDDSGKLTSSIPNQRQIDAYRRHGATLPGQMTREAKPDPGEDGPPAAG